MCLKRARNQIHQTPPTGVCSTDRASPTHEPHRPVTAMARVVGARRSNDHRLPLVRFTVPAPQTWCTPETFLHGAMPWPVSHRCAPVGRTGIGARGHIGQRSKGVCAVVYDGGSGNLAPAWVRSAKPQIARQGCCLSGWQSGHSEGAVILDNKCGDGPGQGATQKQHPRCALE